MEKDILVAVAVNEAYYDLVGNMIEKVEKELERNRSLQRIVREQLQPNSLNKAQFSNFKSNIYFNPYFKDKFGMCPNLSDEANAIKRICNVNILMKPDRQWRPSELKLLCESVKSSVIEHNLISLNERESLLCEKLQKRGVTENKCVKQWKEELEEIRRKANFYRKNGSEKLFLQEVTNSDNIDWSLISVLNFKGERSIRQLCAKWYNDQSPVWTKNGWTKKEDVALFRLYEINGGRWDDIALHIAVDFPDRKRSAFQCFQHWLEIRHSQREKNYWKPDEDKILLEKIQEYKEKNDVISWKNVARFLPGRTKFMCELRYKRSLCDTLKKGAWSKDEDDRLLEAVHKYGSFDWHWIATFVKGRTNLQCRNRYTNKLNDQIRRTPWTLEEDERLLYGINLFGRHRLAYAARFVPGRGMDSIKARFRSYLRAKIMASQAYLSTKNKVTCRIRNPSYVFKGYPAIEENKVLKDESVETSPEQLSSRLRKRHIKIEAKAGPLPVKKTKLESNEDNTDCSTSTLRSDGKWYMNAKGGWLNVEKGGANDLITLLREFTDEKRNEVLNFLATMENGRLGGNEERRDRLTNLMNDAFQILPGDLQFIGKRKFKVLLKKSKKKDAFVSYWPLPSRKRNCYDEDAE